MRSAAAVLCSLCLSSADGAQPDAPPVHSAPIDPSSVPSVGIEGRLSATIAGEQLTAVPVSDRAPLIVRIASAGPAADGAIRYDLRYLGALPGAYDLRDYLLDARGGHPACASLPVRIRSVVPDGSHDLVEVAATASPPLGGYRRLMIASGIAWVFILPLLLWRRRVAPAAAMPSPAGPSVVEQLAGIARRASAGALPAREQARLERLLISHWRDRLGLASLPPMEALAALRADREAGALLRQVERWLHGRPGSGSPVDVDALLAPYRSVSTATTPPPVAGAAP